ncbi:Rep protein [Aviadenovirus bubonis]|nr:Rep protein [Owl adenovirus]
MSATDLYWKLVRSLIDRGITTKEGWSRRDPVEFRHYFKRNQKGFRIRQILADVHKHMFWFKTFHDYCVGSHEVRHCHGNIVYRLLSMNGYDPRLVGSMLVKWAGLSSPRNTVWITGVPSSGADQLVEALVYLSPKVGIADCRNRTNPFVGCESSLLLWWKGGRVSECSVQLVQQVFGGEHVFLTSRTCHADGACEMFRTPVLVFANHDMCSVLNMQGKEVDDYGESLRSTMFKIELTAPLSWMDCVGVGDVYNFLTWASKNETEVPDRHEMK